MFSFSQRKSRLFRKLEADVVGFEGEAVWGFDTAGQRLFKASPDGARFLWALVLIASHYARTATEEVSIDDESAALVVKNECMNVLGEDCEDFLVAMLGV